jgi:maltose phosphorylase
MEKVADNMYFPVSKDLGYTATRWLLDKDLVPVKIWMQHKRPTKMVLGSYVPYIKQADVLQCFYFFTQGRIETQLRIL